MPSSPSPSVRSVDVDPLRGASSAAPTRSTRGGVGVLRACLGAGGATVLSRARATPPLRFVCPSFPGSRAASVCVVTFGGGLIDGDAIELDVVVEAGATLVLFTQASTKAFRGRARQDVRAEVHGTLVMLPDPVACFAGARYTQRVDVALRGEGSVIALDGFTSGRPAFGERWAASTIDLATTVRGPDGAPWVRDALVLDADEAPVAAKMDGFEAVCTLLALGPRVAPVTRDLLAPSIATRDLVAAPSVLRGDGGIARIAATSSALALAEVRRRLRNLPDIDVVDPFASRR